MWDDLLRVAASVKGGHATAALVVGKLCSSRRQQNALAARDQGVRRAAPHRLRRPLLTTLFTGARGCLVAAGGRARAWSRPGRPGGRGRSR
jgi:hypothetical protein